MEEQMEIVHLLLILLHQLMEHVNLLMNAQMQTMIKLHVNKNQIFVNGFPLDRKDNVLLTLV